MTMSDTKTKAETSGVTKKPVVFVDGGSGTTGLGIAERLGAQNDVTVASIADDKRKDSRYVAGRSPYWIKSKNLSLGQQLRRNGSDLELFASSSRAALRYAPAISRSSPVNVVVLVLLRLSTVVLARCLSCGVLPAVFSTSSTYFWMRASISSFSA